MPVEALASATGTATMEITVSKFELLRELTATQGVVERKTTIPILSNYLFEASGDKLSLTATDLDLSLRTACNAKVKKEGACTIPARKLHDYVKLLPDADLTIKLLDSTSIRSSRRVNCDGIGSNSGCYTHSRVHLDAAYPSASSSGSPCTRKPRSPKNSCGKRSKLLRHFRG